MNDKVVCFDLFDTLVAAPSNLPSYEDVLVSRGVSRDEIYPFVRQNLMTGSYSYEEMADMLFRRFDVPATSVYVRSLIDRWKKVNESTEWIPSAKVVLEKLRKQVNARLLLISNATEPGWNSVRERLKVDRFFDDLFLSYQQGVAKPDPKVWSSIAGQNPASEYWMIGNDARDDLEIPGVMGWQTLLVSRGMINVDRIVNLIREKVLIADIDITPQESVDLSKSGMTVVDIPSMSREIESWEGWKEIDPRSALLIFPGKGAEKVRESLDENWLSQFRNQIDVPVSRWWTPYSDPFVTGGWMYPPRMYCDARDVVIIDDVVSSGLTAKRVREANAMWLPRANWNLVTWIAQEAANVKQFKRFFAAKKYGTKERKTPINSLSTLLEDEKLVRTYADRNVSNADGFLASISRMRGQRNGV